MKMELLSENSFNRENDEDSEKKIMSPDSEPLFPDVLMLFLLEHSSVARMIFSAFWL